MRKYRDYLMPALVALISALALAALQKSNKGDRNFSQIPVNLGSDYYVGVSLVEISELNAEGQGWDSYNSSGPDIFVEIYWKGTRIYRSTTKEDTFIARWSSAEIDLRDVALSGKGTSADSLIQGARLNIRQDESIELRVYDSDLVDSEPVGVKEFKTTDLMLGENSFNYKTAGIRRMILKVSEMNDGAIQ